MSGPLRELPGINRRAFLTGMACSAASVGLSPAVQAQANTGGRIPAAAPLMHTHMHVWSDDLNRFPFAHPYEPNIKPPRVAATLELLRKEMDEFGISHCVLVQTIYHGWDNRYLAQCLKADPRRFRGQGLIDPTDARAAERLEFWVREHGLAGMRFSPIYYRGKDDWLNAEPARAVWKKAEELKAVFNFFIAA